MLCLGQLMMVLDATIVNVALPSIQRDLHFTQANLTWVLDGYLITFGGFLLLAGRVGDLVGRKKVFLTGLVLFTAASVLCGSPQSQTMLIVARLLQGVGGAVASSVILAIIVTEFPERARAGEGDGHVCVRLGRRRLDRVARGRRADAVAELALDLLRERADRRDRVRARVGSLIEENEGIGLAGGVDVAGSILITLATMSGAFAIVKSTRIRAVLGAHARRGRRVACCCSAPSWSLEGRIWPTRSCR